MKVAEVYLLGMIFPIISCCRRLSYYLEVKNKVAGAKDVLTLVEFPFSFFVEISDAIFLFDIYPELRV